jgi:hypothetical protein
MTFDWQQLVALACVGLAAGYVMRRIWRACRQPSPDVCGACARCALVWARTRATGRIRQTAGLSIGSANSGEVSCQASLGSSPFGCDHG